MTAKKPPKATQPPSELRTPNPYRPRLDQEALNAERRAIEEKAKVKPKE